jgi:hypothetical protein
MINNDLGVLTILDRRTASEREDYYEYQVAGGDGQLLDDGASFREKALRNAGDDWGPRNALNSMLEMIHMNLYGS